MRKKSIGEKQLKHHKPKLLFLTNIPSPYRVSFFNELGKKCSLTVTFEGKTASDRDRLWKHEKMEYFRPVFLKGIRTGTDHFLCPGIIRMLKQKWDAVIVGTYATPTAMLAIEYMKIYSIRFFIEADGGFVKADSRFRFWLKRHFISSACGWFSSGEVTTKYLVHYGADKNKCYKYPFTSLKKEDMIKNNVPCAEDRRMAKQELGIYEKYAVLSVGRFAYENGYGKGFDNLMRIAEKSADDIGFYIAGDKPAKEFLDWKKEKKLKHVHFISFQEKDWLAKYYIAADIFMLLTRADVWGLAVNEAMANALPVITTDKCVAGTELVEHNRNGFLVSPENWKEAAAHMEHLLQNGEMRDKFGRFGYEKICRYTIENMSLEHLKILLGGGTVIRKNYAKARLGIVQDKMVLTASQIIPRKGVDVLLEAARLLDDSEAGFYIAGGRLPENMKKLVKWNSQVYFEGFKTKEELGDYYRAADIFAFPTRMDVWGLVVNEAMSYGIPVITTNQCAAGLELVSDGVNGSIISVDDSVALAEKIMEIFENNRILEMGIHAWHAIHGWTIEAMVQEHMKVFQEQLNGTE